MSENTDEDLIELLPQSTFVRDFAKAWHDETVSCAEEVDADDFRVGVNNSAKGESDTAFTVTHRGDQLLCRVVVYEQNGRCGVLFCNTGPVEAVETSFYNF